MIHYVIGGVILILLALIVLATALPVNRYLPKEYQKKIRKFSKRMKKITAKKDEKTMDLFVDGKKIASVKEKDAFKVNMPENIVCDFCRKLMPEPDMLYIWEDKEIKFICKNCISFVKMPKKED